MTARLARITLFPIKALPGTETPEARVLECGALAHDRRYAMRAADGGFINAKRTAKVHSIRVEYGPGLASASFSRQGQSSPWMTLSSDSAAIEHWLSENLEQPVTWVENAQTGFPDDTDSPGPTIVSTATLAEVASWFGISVDDARRRFRSNLEIDGVPAFWEDRLCGDANRPIVLEIGGAEFFCVNPCQRCVTPSRSPDSREATPRFVATFTENRQRTLPEWANRGRFDHFYRLAVNTRLHRRSGEGLVRVGDEAKIVSA
jgi:uncharacterized protein YcbX